MGKFSWDDLRHPVPENEKILCETAHGVRIHVSFFILKLLNWAPFLYLIIGLAFMEPDEEVMYDPEQRRMTAYLITFVSILLVAAVNLAPLLLHSVKNWRAKLFLTDRNLHLYTKGKASRPVIIPLNTLYDVTVSYGIAEKQSGYPTLNILTSTDSYRCPYVQNATEFVQAVRRAMPDGPILCRADIKPHMNRRPLKWTAIILIVVLLGINRAIHDHLLATKGCLAAHEIERSNYIYCFCIFLAVIYWVTKLALAVTNSSFIKTTNHSRLFLTQSHLYYQKRAMHGSVPLAEITDIRARNTAAGYFRGGKTVEIQTLKGGCYEIHHVFNAKEFVDTCNRLRSGA